MANQQAIISILAFFLICTCVQAKDWQGIGNFTSGNTTFIWNTINGNIVSFTNIGGIDYAGFAQNISRTLNNAWDLAWNVFIF
jgi:hypothetical protein